ncbi:MULTISPECIES: GGDEF domain-containing protein [Clostridium]|uniref:Cyclic di-GMP phosphodiesterase Gmr n=3 Tax=Clostridium TaxID=1485 RepID=D8GNL7_CLOLD|nr:MULTISPECIES: GGDEF domain-containing protein [Clostridium]ADK15880.1 putative GGDEF domain protein [Clostridium ljungdahlii DSM 13528]AGY75053.1 GGDEF domain-containing protein [Clostridium autoethanogenum DSM 10061]ALU35227.1 Diguanylate cyclase [Clostridium autoethanogenum DSM 10061]OAA87242.1 Cyclic di-GMP phosphodiesterase Gmr [Clostridium ljungdahlii DSM 13528]OVY49694.1 Cyclic di-GMP phosphodiesterase Gmr [Clostridium autoethanogenum]
MPGDSDFFEAEKALIKEARELIKGEKCDKKTLLKSFTILTEQFDKLIRDVEKIIKISDGQQEYLHRIQGDLKKEIEDRIRAEEKLKYFAAIDSLTGCYNRGMGLAFLDTELNAIKRNKSFFSICYIDVNGLKYVNDNFGHFEGDELLVMVCRFIKKVIRSNDILCRLGGDEFLIIFSNSKKENVEKAIERINFDINSENEKKLKPYSVSFSYGIFQVDYGNSLSIDEIIQRADAKMYENKQKCKKLG